MGGSRALARGTFGQGCKEENQGFQCSCSLLFSKAHPPWASLGRTDIQMVPTTVAGIHGQLGPLVSFVKAGPSTLGETSLSAHCTAQNSPPTR